MISGNLGVVDQVGDGTRLRLSAEIDGTAGWVVADRGGSSARSTGATAYTTTSWWCGCDPA
jgi:hypothetical protein